MRPLIVFDLDGTLIDSQRDLAESANEMLAAYGAEPLSVSDVAAMVGDGARQLVERALEAAGVTTDLSQALDRFLSIYRDHLVVHTRPYAGLPETVANVSPRAALGLLTNKPEGFTRRLLEEFGMAAHFRWVIGGDSGFPRKPDPSGLRHLMRAAGVTPARCLMVGDSAVDAETARNAGASLCVAQYGFGQLRRPITLDAHDVVAHHPSDVAGRLDAFLVGRP